MRAEITERRDFYVYALLREDGKTPFYIGKGRGNRVQSHFAPANLKRRSRKNSVIRKVKTEIGQVPHEIFHFGLTEVEAHEREREAIACIGRIDNPYNTGPLTNLTDGGEGASRVWSQAARESARASALRPETRAAKSAALKARFSDPDVLAAANAAKRRGTSTPEFAQKTAVRMKALLAIPGWREARTEKSVAAMRTSAHREKMSVILTELSTSPEGRALRAAASAVRWAKEGSREIASAKIRAAKGTPEARAAISAKSKAAWARRKAEAAKCG